MRTSDHDTNVNANADTTMPRTALSSATRRHFLGRTLALTVAFSLTPAAVAITQGAGSGAATATAAALPISLRRNPNLGGWLRINADGSVTVFTGKVELGQGILSALSQIVADELDVDLARIRMVSGDTSRTPNEGYTAGSVSIEQSGSALRAAAAEARDLLLQTASEQLKLPIAALVVHDGNISIGADAGATVQATYWRLSADVDLNRPATARIAPKQRSHYRWVGTSALRRDIPAKVSGGDVFLHDMRLPDMLFGRVVRPPAPGAKLLSADLAAARALPGVVVVVRDGSFLAVAAEREEQAIGALRALRASARWSKPDALPESGDALIASMKQMDAITSIANEKNQASAPVGVLKTIEAEYTKPFLAHASIGPSCAVAQMKDGKLMLWSHSQGVFQLHAEIATVMGMDPADVIVAHRDGSGCYGHNGADDVTLDAALLARHAGARPIKMQWMQEDEFGWAPKGSAMAFHLRASLDAEGNVVDWQHALWSHSHNMRPGFTDDIALLASWDLEQPFKRAKGVNVPLPNGGGERNAVPLYQFPRQKITNHLIPEPTIRTSAVRALGAYGNIFALESFIDELALAAAIDPVQFRLRHLSDPRARAVIEQVALETTRTPSAARSASSRLSGRGIAFSQYKNHAAYLAVVVDVEIDPGSGLVTVNKMHAVAEAGLIVNPDGFKNQIEGGLIQSASWTLREEMAFGPGGIVTQSWADYPILRFPDVPQVTVTLIDRPELPSLGVGEAAQGPAAAAIANAVAHALGVRVRQLPLTPERILRAIGKAA
jgi:nicotinate dehydrogenase subunit B